jgi:hypothetical protein
MPSSRLRPLPKGPGSASSPGPPPRAWSISHHVSGVDASQQRVVMNGLRAEARGERWNPYQGRQESNPLLRRGTPYLCSDCWTHPNKCRTPAAIGTANCRCAFQAFPGVNLRRLHRQNAPQRRPSWAPIIPHGAPGWDSAALPVTHSSVAANAATQSCTRSSHAAHTIIVLLR